MSTGRLLLTKGEDCPCRVEPSPHSPPTPRAPAYVNNRVAGYHRCGSVRCGLKEATSLPRFPLRLALRPVANVESDPCTYREYVLVNQLMLWPVCDPLVYSASNWDGYGTFKEPSILMAST